MSAEAFVVVYSCTDKDSFESVGSFLDRISRMKGDESRNSAIVIVENKFDLKEERKVSVLEGKELANSMNLPFIQTSAKMRTNIDELFVSLYKMYLGEMGVFEMIETFDLREWKEEEFKLMPKDFRERVNSFLLVLKRFGGTHQTEMGPIKKSIVLPSLKVPKPIVKIMLRYLFEQEMKTWK